MMTPKEQYEIIMEMLQNGLIPEDNTEITNLLNDNNLENKVYDYYKKANMSPPIWFINNYPSATQIIKSNEIYVSYALVFGSNKFIFFNNRSDLEEYIQKYPSQYYLIYGLSEMIPKFLVNEKFELLTKTYEIFSEKQNITKEFIKT